MQFGSTSLSDYCGLLHIEFMEFVFMPALFWSKMSTGLPIDISSSMRGQNYISFCRMDIDIHRNIPHIHLHVKHGNKDKWHGAEIQVVIEGNWTTYRVCPGGQISTWIPDAAANAVNKRNNPSAGELCAARYNPICSFWKMLTADGAGICRWITRWH
ncbi:hypothetical protein V6N12_025935 [Hibiscus sabdariffa]|uniref:Uncharacterized protein n=1 Tax=Hibiscus sabdariffa TaxID=183260 RepID=A0ABR2DTD5_9ROSI